MDAPGPGDLLLIRHAPVARPGQLYGRTDVPADLGDGQALDALRSLLATVETRISSPALRCRQTAAAIWGDAPLDMRPELWEQDFGDHEGLALSDLPDLGRLSGEELARYCPPNGESFLDVVGRINDIYQALTRESESKGATTVVAHSGVIRAMLSLTLGVDAAGLAFGVDPLSVTWLRCAQGTVAIQCVNAPPVSLVRHQ